MTAGVARREIVATVRAADWTERRPITRTVVAARHRWIQSPEQSAAISINTPIHFTGAKPGIPECVDGMGLAAHCPRNFFVGDLTSKSVDFDVFWRP